MSYQESSVEYSGGYNLGKDELQFIQAALRGDDDGDPEVAARRAAKRAVEQQLNAQPMVAEAEVE